MSRIDQITAQQGWNDQSLLQLASQFITAKGLDDQYVDYLTTQAAEENGDTQCAECGEVFFLDENEIANHVGDGTDGIDHDADADHVPYAAD